VFETYEWYVEKFFDSRVRQFLQGHVSPEFMTQHGPRVWGIPKSAQEISEGTKLPPKRVMACLTRLQKKNAILADGDKWKIKDPR